MNTQINITENGTTTLATAGKYCDRNIDVNVSVEGGADYTSFLDGTITGEYINEELTALRHGAFAGTNFTKILIPNCTTITGNRQFNSCPNLEEVNLSGLTTANDVAYMFNDSPKIKRISFPLLTTTGNTGGCFYGCAELERVDFNSLSGATLGNYTFRDCKKLKTVVIGGSVLCPLNNENVFAGASSTWIVYVPDNLVTAYQSATNWVKYASRIKGLSELTEE